MNGASGAYKIARMNEEDKHYDKELVTGLCNL